MEAETSMGCEVVKRFSSQRLFPIVSFHKLDLALIVAAYVDKQIKLKDLERSSAKHRTPSQTQQRDSIFQPLSAV